MVFRLSIWLAMFAAVVPGQAVDEYQVKAAFLYNFAKFVEWPSQAFKAASDPFTICIFGQNPFGSALEEAISRNLINGRALVIRQLAGAPPSCNCQILFVPSSERKRFRAIAARFKEAGVLTVGETEGFAEDGGVVNLKLEAGRVRFEINVAAAEREQLHISSKLLSLAQIVKK